MITLCAIVKNEEQFLAKCLKSVQGLVDEIVIVDTGSSDNTIEIAEYFRARIFHFRWNNDFSAARNYALSKVQKDSWVLVLDADEELTENSKKNLRMISQVDPKDTVFFLKVISPTTNNVVPEEANNANILRFFKNDGKIRFDRPIHEEITAENYRREFSGAEIIHYGYIPTLNEQREKIKRNFDCLVKGLEAGGNDLYYLYQLGVTAYVGNDIGSALNFLTEADNVYKKGHKKVAFTPHLYSLLGVCWNRVRDYEKALFYIKEGLKIAPSHYELHFSYGQTHKILGNYQEALAGMKNCLLFGYNKGQDFNLASSDRAILTWKAFFEIGNIKMLQAKEAEGEIRDKELKKALFAFSMALVRNPGNELVRKHLAGCVKELTNYDFGIKDILTEDF